jgi:hypothetical protein
VAYTYVVVAVNSKLVSVAVNFGSVVNDVSVAVAVNHHSHTSDTTIVSVGVGVGAEYASAAFVRYSPQTNVYVVDGFSTRIPDLVVVVVSGSVVVTVATGVGAVVLTVVPVQQVAYTYSVVILAETAPRKTRKLRGGRNVRMVDAADGY